MKKASRAKGTRDFLPEQMRRRNKVIEVIREVFECYGYEPMETPSLEKWEVLKGKLGDEGEQLLFKILRRGNHTPLEQLRHKKITEATYTSFEDAVDLALRYDLTVPFSRVLAMNSGLAKPFKRYQIQPVWRADQPSKGRFREFYQCDVDIAGCAGMMADAEITAIVHDVMVKLGFKDFRIRLNHRKLLNGLVDVAGGKEHLQDLCVAIDKLDKIGVKGVKAEFERRGIAEEVGDAVLQNLSFKGSPEEVLAAIEPLLADHPEGQAGIAETRELFELLSHLGIDPAFTPLDLYLVRGLDYYTGPILEVVVDEPAIGSLGGGGRYDDLIERLSGESIPATGATIGLERIIYVMEELGMLPPQPPLTQVLVTVFQKETLSDSLRFTQMLRNAGIRAEVYMHPGDKMKRQFKYASRQNIPLIALIGPNEAEKGEVKLQTGPKNARFVSQEEAAQNILEMLG